MTSSDEAREGELPPDEFATLSSDIIGGRHAPDSDEARRLNELLERDPDQRVQHQADEEIALAYRELNVLLDDQTDRTHLDNEVYFQEMALRVRRRLRNDDQQRVPPRNITWGQRIRHALFGGVAASLAIVLGMWYTGQEPELEAPGGLRRPLPLTEAVSVRDLAQDEIGRFHYLGRAENWDRWRRRDESHLRARDAHYSEINREIFENYQGQLAKLRDDASWSERCRLKENLAEVLVRFGVFDEAERWYRSSLATCRAADEESNSLRRQQHELKLLVKVGEFEQALDLATRILDTADLTERAQRNLAYEKALLLLRLNRDREAEAIATQLAQECTSQEHLVPVLTLLGRVRERLGDWRGAADAYSRSRGLAVRDNLVAMLDDRLQRIDYAQKLAPASRELARKLNQEGDFTPRYAMRSPTDGQTAVTPVALSELDVAPSAIHQYCSKANTVAQVWQKNASSRAYLGVRLAGPQEPACQSSKPGLRVEAVVPGSPADRTGLRPGDRIVAFDDTPIGSGELDLYHLIGLIHQAGPGAAVALKVRRDGETRVLKTVLGKAE